MAQRDIYDRRPTSTSRGKTIQRIMDKQHAPGVLPGAEQVLDDAPDGSIAAAIRGFHRAWVETRPVTTRRAYERSLTLLARDLAANGPHPREASSALGEQRVIAHLDWRLEQGLHDPGELQRAVLHLARLLEWSAQQASRDAEIDRSRLRAAAAERISDAPPAFHAAADAAALRDTSADADLLDP